MRRGFKAEAERLAKQVRGRLGLKPSDPLKLGDLAGDLNVEVRRADDLVDRSKLQELERLQPGAFSACTFRLGKRRVIAYSPIASPGRRRSDVAHELAHILLGHQMNTVEKVGEIAFFTCDVDEEQEANWLAGCLLLPHPLLMRAARSGLDAAAIAQKYEVSEKMASFRLRTTGVLRQLKAARASR